MNFQEHVFTVFQEEAMEVAHAVSKIKRFSLQDGYAGKAVFKDAEFANEVSALARRAGVNSPFCKAPD